MAYGDPYDTSPGLSLAGKGGLALAFVAFLVLTLLPGNGTVAANQMFTGHGVCFPTLESLPVPGKWAVWINILVISVAGIFSVMLTKHYNYVSSGNLLYVIAMFVMCGAVPMISERLNSGVLMLVVVLICMRRMFSLYGRRYCAEGIFLIFCLLSIGSMIQYGFVLLMPVFLLGACFMRLMRFREVIAMFIGILTPYWILLATGLIEFHDLRAPSLSNMFRIGQDPLGFFQMVLTIGISVLYFVFALLANLTRGGADGVMQRSRREVMHLLGFSLLWFMVFDFTNILTYLPSFFLCTGYECAFWGMRLRANQRHNIALSLFLIYIPLAIVFDWF